MSREGSKSFDSTAATKPTFPPSVSTQEFKDAIPHDNIHENQNNTKVTKNNDHDVGQQYHSSDILQEDSLNKVDEEKEVDESFDKQDKVEDDPLLDTDDEELHDDDYEYVESDNDEDDSIPLPSTSYRWMRTTLISA